MKTLKEYEKLVMVDMGIVQPDGTPWPERKISMGYYTLDISNRMLILAMTDFLKGLNSLKEKDD